MERLIKDGDVILDGTLTKKDKIAQALKKLEDIEELMECYYIEDLSTLHRVLYLAFSLGEIKTWKKREDALQEMLDNLPKDAKPSDKLNALIGEGKI